MVCIACPTSVCCVRVCDGVCVSVYGWLASFLSRMWWGGGSCDRDAHAVFGRLPTLALGGAHVI